MYVLANSYFLFVGRGITFSEITGIWTDLPIKIGKALKLPDFVLPELAPPLPDQLPPSRSDHGDLVLKNILVTGDTSISQFRVSA